MSAARPIRHTRGEPATVVAARDKQLHRGNGVTGMRVSSNSKYDPELG